MLVSVVDLVNLADEVGGGSSTLPSECGAFLALSIFVAVGEGLCDLDFSFGRGGGGGGGGGGG